MSSSDLRILEWLRAQPRSFDELKTMAERGARQNESHGLDQLLEAWESLGLLEVVSEPDAH